jgi:hypothetical protein
MQRVSEARQWRLGLPIIEVNVCQFMGDDVGRAARLMRLVDQINQMGGIQENLPDIPIVVHHRDHTTCRASARLFVSASHECDGAFQGCIDGPKHVIQVETDADAVQFSKIEFVLSFIDDGFDRCQELAIPCFSATAAMKGQQ